MRALSFIVSALLAGSAFAQAPASVYTPSGRDLGVPTFINATVVRVNSRANTITFRSESGEVSLTVEGGAVARLGRLRAGDEVLLGYRVDDRTGRPVQVVTAILAGEGMADRGLVAATSATAAPVALSTVSGRVIATDLAAGTITIADAEGRTGTLAVQGTGLVSLGGVSVGDQVDVSFTPGAAAGGLVGGTVVLGTVGAIQPVTPSFITGQVTTFDAATGALRLRTAFGERMFTLPAGRFDAGTLRVGQDVRLDLAGRGGTAVSGVSTLAGTRTTGAIVAGQATPTVTTGQRITATGVRGTFTTPLTGSGGGAVPTTTGTLAGVQTIRASGTLNTGNAAPAAPVATAPGTLGAVASGPFNTTGLNAADVNAGAGNAGALTAAGTVSFPGAVGGDFVATGGTISTPGSPFAAVVPSLPSVVGQLNVVPPPQGAPAMPDTLPVGAARELATRDYDNAVRMMAMKANEIDAHWFRYRDGCLRSSALTAEIDRELFATNRDREWFVLYDEDVRTPADDNCRQLRVELNRLAMDWSDTMTRLEDTARRNDVLPGAMRDIRQRYRVEF